MKRLILFTSLVLALMSCGNRGGNEGAGIPAATVVFGIEDVFELQKGLAVAGILLDGTIRVSDQLDHYNMVGEKEFSCTVVAIEQPPRKDLKEASADDEMTSFTLFIKDKKKDDFYIDGYLANGDVLKWADEINQP